MRNKVTSAAEAVAIVQSGDAICTSGFVGIGVPMPSWSPWKAVSSILANHAI